MRSRGRSAVALALLIGSLPVLHAGGASQRGGCGRPADFDGDGYSDLALGAPQEDVGAVEDAGGVNVLYGASSGLNASGNDFWTQDTSGVRGAAEEGDAFGSALATADFDGDGYTDLAIGAPFEDLGESDNGAVTVLYGTRNGLSARGDQAWSQDSPGVAGVAESTDRFGSALAAGDFDRDGFGDLAIAAPNENVQIGRYDWVRSAGRVTVLYGSGDGLTASGDQRWSQHTSGIASDAEHGDGFGQVIVAADIDADGACDLAVAAPSETLDGRTGAGVVHVIFGSRDGLTARGDEFWHQNSPGIRDVSEDGDGFGSSLAAGDFDDDGYRDLAIGVTGENVESIQGAGAVAVLYGSSGGLTARDQIWTQASPGIQDGAEGSDQFGYSVATGDFDRDGFGDLAVGVPFEDREQEPVEQNILESLLPEDPTTQRTEAVGVVHVLFGSRNGLSDRDQLWTQDSPGVQNARASGDLFGWTLSSGRFNKGSAWDLVIGVPGESVSEDVFQTGAAHVLYGTSDGLTSDGDDFWTQDTADVRDRAERDDVFARVVS